MKMEKREEHFTSINANETNAGYGADADLDNGAERLFEQEIDFSLKELLVGIFSKIRPLYSIDAVALILYNKEMSHINSAYLIEAGIDEKSCLETVTYRVGLSPITTEIAGFDFPILKSRQEWIAEFGDNHYFPSHAADFQFHCYIPLESEGRILGTFEVHNYNRELSTDGLNYCCNVANFISGLLSVMKEKDFENSSALPELVQESNQNSSFSNLNAINRNLRKEVKLLQEQLAAFQLFKQETHDAVLSHPEIIGTSAEMQEVFSLLKRISSLDTTVLILGETGTGKELIAKAIHNQSARKNKTMIKINCAAIPANLVESELFGHEKGSFTGATEKRVGKFEQAHQGTIFLDEVGELTLDLQVKLLRVLQEKEIERIGGKLTISTDVRIISATNVNLLAAVEEGRFRRDLFYRLNVFPVSLPPLRNRKDDIPLLADFFLQKFARKSKKAFIGFSKKAISDMKAYHWPGNVRELEHLIEREVVMAHGPVIRNVEIPKPAERMASSIATVKTIFENERDHIFAVLELCNGRISGENGAAKLLGVPATTLNSKIKRLGLSKKHVF